MASSIPSGIFVPADRPITVGHGEYVVYHHSATGGKTAPARPTFEAALAVLNHFNFQTTDDRYEVIRSKIKGIDPTLEITFVPRTYYEMQFLKKGIKEDLARNDFCTNESVRPDPYTPHPTEGCWHTAYFEGEEDNNAEAVRTLAFNLNQNLVKKINKYLPGQTAFNFGALSYLTTKQTAFFRQFHDTFNLQQKQSEGAFKTAVFSEGTPIEKFSNDSHCFSMGIKDDQDAAFIQRAITLECHPIAESSYLLSRGTDFPTDLPYSPYNLDAPYSFSFGHSLFAGAMYNSGATSFVYMKGSQDGYVMAIPAKGEEADLFVVPKKHAICHLSSNHGVVFHPRSKVWKTAGDVWGFASFGRVRDIVEPFFSPLDRETLTDRMLAVKNNNAIFLRSATKPLLSLPPAFQPTIHIHANVPSGKNLFIRGSAPLSWEKSQPLVQIGDGHWIYRNPTLAAMEYKVLIDDLVWEEGPTHRMESGQSAVEAPYFNTPSAPIPGKGTSLSIRYNAGWGNSLSIVGSGPGMNWDHPTPLKNVGDDLWLWESTSHFENFEYKLVLNNSVREVGPNHRAHHGRKEEVFPRF